MKNIFLETQLFILMNDDGVKQYNMSCMSIGAIMEVHVGLLIAEIMFSYNNHHYAHRLNQYFLSIY